MTESNKTRPAIGGIEWRDITVDNAEQLRDFYSDVVGWRPEAVSMGDYDDFNMNQPETGETIVGICHARGSNADMPPQWLMYVRVEYAKNSAEKVKELGGQVLQGPAKMNNEVYYVIQDPAGAVLTIFSAE